MATLFWVAVLPSCGGTPDPSGQVPVVVISLDTVRADRVGFLGGKLPDGSSPTPHLDDLARRSVGPREGITPAPLTLPAHTSLFSGLYPDRHGIRENDSFRVPPRNQRGYPLLAEEFQDAGYVTAAFVSGQPLERSAGLNQGFVTYDDTDEADNPEDRLRFRERRGEDTVDRALDWLRARKSEPWFLFVHLFDAHDPYDWHGPEGGLNPNSRDDRYLSEILHMDRQVGRLLSEVPAHAVVVVLSDHGEGLGEHGEETHGFTLHSSTLRVPFLLALPESLEAPAHLSDRPARLVDVAPTLRSLCGLPGTVATDGENLLTRSPSGPWSAFAETLYPYYQFQYAHERAWFDPEWKLLDAGGERRRLYRWGEDRAEIHDCARTEEPQAKTLVEALLAFLNRAAGERAFDVLVDPSAVAPYMGGRPLAFPVEPDAERNGTRPRVEDRWEVVRALDEARGLLRPPNREPHRALAVLERYGQERDENPSLLWWTARCEHLRGEDPGASERIRELSLGRALELFTRHHERFQDGRALDAVLRVLLDRHSLRGRPEDLETLDALASGEIGVGKGRALTYALRASGRERRGRLGDARTDLEAALQEDPDPLLRMQIRRHLERLRD